MNPTNLAERIYGSAAELILREIGLGGERAQRRAIIIRTQVGHSNVDKHLTNLEANKLIRQVSQHPAKFEITRKGHATLSKLYGKINRDAYEIGKIDRERLFEIKLGETAVADFESLPDGTIAVIPRLSSDLQYRENQIHYMHQLLTELNTAMYNSSSGFLANPLVYYLGDFLEYGGETFRSLLTIPILSSCDPEDIPELLDDMESKMIRR